LTGFGLAGAGRALGQGGEAEEDNGKSQPSCRCGGDDEVAY